MGTTAVQLDRQARTTDARNATRTRDPERSGPRTTAGHAAQSPAIGVRAFPASAPRTSCLHGHQLHHPGSYRIVAEVLIHRMGVAALAPVGRFPDRRVYSP